MTGREPSAIWRASIEDGRRRLERPAQVLAATGLLGGFHHRVGLTPSSWLREHLRR